MYTLYIIKNVELSFSNKVSKVIVKDLNITKVLFGNELTGLLHKVKHSINP